MRRIAIASLILVVAACSAEQGRTVAPPTNDAAGAVGAAGAAAAPSPEADPTRWVDEHFAAGWFSEAVPVDAEGELQGGAPRRFPGEEVNLDPTGEAFEDGPASTPPSPPAAESPGPPRRSQDFDGMEVEEESPRFGAASEGVSPFGGAGGLAGEDGTEAAPAQPWNRSTRSPNDARLMVGDDDALPLQSFQATVRIDGHRARVVLDYCYLNNFDFDAEGVFKLRLPDDAAVHYLAFGDAVAEAPLLVDAPGAAQLDLSSSALTAARGGATVHREARIVPREQAQQAYAAETARRVDPALMEWNGAGVFTTRVYPLVQDHVSRITVAYDVDLVQQGGSRHLDLGVPAAEHGRRVVVDVDGAPTERRVFENPEDTVLRVSLPDRGATALVGDDPAIGPHFALSVAPAVPDVAATPSRRAIFLLDVSMSSNPERMNVWLDLLRQTLERNRDDLSEFGVLLFNVESWWWRERLAPNEPETVQALLDDLSRVALEGATDLGGALREAAAPSWTTAPLGADLFLLSDGAETWGTAAALDVADGLGRPVICYTTGLPGTDTRALEALARETGGAVFAVNGTADVAAAAVAHRSRPWTLREVHVPGCADVLVAGRPAAIHPGQRLRIAGRGRPAQGDAVELVLEQAGRTERVRVPIAGVLPSELAPRAYGEIATGQLESLGNVASAESRAYALHYGVAGETCSLLMLESDEDYLRYGIEDEQEAEVVRQRPVAAVLSSLASESVRARGDAREAFLVWLDRLERLFGDTPFRDLDEVRAAARSLPVSAFDVASPRLACRTRTWDDVAHEYEKMMREADPRYGPVQIEAEGRRSVRGTDDALRALSSLVEADAGSADLRRDVALTALDWDRPAVAFGLLRRVADARPFEPETYRALAQCAERTGNVDYAMLLYELSLRGPWDERFGAFPLVAAMDYRGLLRRMERSGAATRLGALADAARERIASDYVKGDADLVVTMTWNTDRTDVDLHVTDPANELCKYDHPRTAAGGAITRDVTQGYGPEMFVLGRAVPGEYVVAAHYFGSDALRKTLRSRVFVTVTRHCGAPDEQSEQHAFVLEATDETAEVLRFKWGD